MSRCMHFNTDRSYLQSAATSNGPADWAMEAACALCLTFTILAGAVYVAAALPPSAQLPAVTLTEQNNGKTVEVETGQKVVVRLASNPTTGYQWSVQGDRAPLAIVKSDYSPSSPNRQMPGAGGVQTIRFVAKSAGKVELRLEYRRSWERNVPPAKTYTVTVVVR